MSGPSTVSSSADDAKIAISLDLVAAARHHLSFLRSISDYSLVVSHRSIQRYEKLWMPLIAALLDSSPMILPPADVHWIWHCHCLHNPVRYREYCALRFGKVIEPPAIFDEENEDYAILMCREVWESRYPSEPFDLESDGGDEVGDGDGEIFAAVLSHRRLVPFFSDVFVSETVYLVSAKQRYVDFLHLVKKFGDERTRLVPASDVLLMWLTHKSFPVSYAKDLDADWELDRKIVAFGDQASDKEMEETKRIWEKTFDEPYERPGALFDPISSLSRVFFNWVCCDADVNRIYKGLHPRFLMEPLQEIFLPSRKFLLHFHAYLAEKTQ